MRTLTRRERSTNQLENKRTQQGRIRFACYCRDHILLKAGLPPVSGVQESVSRRDDEDENDEQHIGEDAVQQQLWLVFFIIDAS